MKTVIYNIANISCHHCVNTIENEVGELEGVKTVNADVANQTATIIFDSPATEEQIKALLAEINYPVTSEELAGS